MDIDSVAFREHIYHLICGDFSLEEGFIAEKELVTSEFAADSLCSTAYNRMLSAYSHVCVRLGTEEWADADVEVIIQSLMEIGSHLALKMFEYGVFFARRDSSRKN